MRHPLAAVAGALTALVLLFTGAGSAAAASPPRSLPPGWLDGFRIGWVPPGAGDLVTDFASEWEEVRSRTRVWESGPSDDGGYRVDLQVAIMRSPTFTDPAAVREFLINWLERDPAGWATLPYRHPDGSGFGDDDELFWLVEPGVAVRVSAPPGAVAERELHRAARSVRQGEAVPAQSGR
ncbi:hypothetical protein [Microlunatus sp. GCM10028923]|uniref:hypothetical protein n=1 Tax=Microlunatus sp. GCM10028923 TaxID=3273400 RepID=UPI00360A7D20